jgi:prefoldin subunit 5
VEEGLGRQQSLEEENKRLRAKIEELEESKRKMESELKENLEGCKVNVSYLLGEWRKTIQSKI